ncbi:NAD(P)H-quinone oxidoreductase [Streptosporangiaceae bacterium NEAU-GS5]|nr:NAD(P)H-quinone oxidoreductase [Streptosporangiaceae bacterium NEAU-GS5]
MHAVVISEPGGPEVLVWREVPDPRPARGEVVIDVAASAVNRADLMQRQGFYPPPPGASEIPGLECSGVVSEVGEGVDGISVGDQVCALLAGGGYAERVAVPWQQVMPLPAGLVESAAFPEVACTVWSMVFMAARLRKGETLLVHGGTSGIGSLAIQLAKAYGSQVVATAGSPEKVQKCRDLGADEAINYRTEDFARLRADVVLDLVGGPYLQRNLEVLNIGGRLVVIGLQGGARAELDLGMLLGKRCSIHAAGLRVRPVDEKGVICRGVAENVWPLVSAGAIVPVIHATFPMSDAAEAHRVLESGQAVGKVLIVS